MAGPTIGDKDGVPHALYGVNRSLSFPVQPLANPAVPIRKRETKYLPNKKKTPRVVKERIKKKPSFVHPLGNLPTSKLPYTLYTPPEPQDPPTPYLFFWPPGFATGLLQSYNKVLYIRAYLTWPGQEKTHRTFLPIRRAKNPSQFPSNNHSVVRWGSQIFDKIPVANYLT